jgi:conjugative transposon TraN protein
MRFFFFFLLLSKFSFAQTAQLQICVDKTTSLVFPFPVHHVDRGTENVLVHETKGNILFVKAKVSGFAETNLTVVTEDGAVYVFDVRYDEAPGNFVYYLRPFKYATVASYAEGILDNQQTMYGIRFKKLDIEALVAGIYIKNDVIYLQLKLSNDGPIDFDIDLLKLFIRDQKKSKRTAVQENEVVPLHVSGNAREVKSNFTSTIVVALQKFTIPDSRIFYIQIFERNGGRHLRLRVKNSKLIQAIQLPDKR